MNKTILNKLIYGNRLVLVCVIFTITTMLDLILCVPQGIMEITYKHLADRFILCLGAALSLMVFRYFKNLPLYCAIIIHFFVCILMMLLYFFSATFYMEIHPNAYRDAVRTIFYAYPPIVIGGLVIDAIRTIKANRILRKVN